MAEQMYRGDAPSEILPKEVSQEIWADTQEESAVMRHSQRITLPGAGLEIPMVTADPSANWVTETDEIGAGTSSLSHKAMQGYKLGVIETFSKEFRRDLPAVYGELRSRLPKTLAAKFDATVFHGSAPGSNFDVLSGADALPLNAASAYENLVAIDQKVAAANGELNAYVLAPKARGVLLSATDENGRPLLINDIQREGGVSQLLGVPVSRSRGVYAPGTPESEEGADDGVAEILGVAGDWTNAYFGVVEDIAVEVTDQASVTVGSGEGARTLNLWQRDMFAVKVTVHLGFIVRDADRFVKITGAVPASA